MELLNAVPSLSVLGDLSHYCVVTESPCGDPDLEECIAALLPKVHHIHARVGFEQGPQVPDPRMPKFAGQLEGHAKWWAAIFKHAQARGDASISVTPEFLPAPYCWTTVEGEPVADTKEVNAYMAQYVRKLFADTIGA